MAPIKFEEQIKEKLEKRTLSPSTQSWAKLAERLDADDKKSKNPLFWWLSIAAGLLIMIAVTVQYYNNDNIENTPAVLVDKDSQEENIEKQTPNKNELNSIELVSDNKPNEEELKSQPRIKKEQEIDYKKVSTTLNTKTRLANNNEKKVQKSLSNTKESNKEIETLNTQSVLNKEAVANVLTEIKAENTSVTDREIDSLLKVASKELFKDRLQKEKTKIVDADALLQNVEEDMGQSFRSRVFEALKDGYKTIKTSVAERNN